MIEPRLFMQAARGLPTTHPPIWFMRQAGRVLPEFRATRARYTLLEICAAPELCAEVALQPVQRFGVDAAILFADIMLPLIGVGVQLDLVDEVGPVIRHPISSVADVRRLRPLEPEADVSAVLETVTLLKAALPSHVALIGFSGAPFTLAAYLIEGRPSRDFARTRSLMHAEPQLWHALMDRLTRDMIAYLTAQLRVGVDAVQLFDSWIGCLSPDDYRAYVQPYTRRIFAALAPWECPLIHFGTNTWALLDEMKRDGASIMGVDWRCPLDEAWERLGSGFGIQGNLDPAILLAPPSVVEASTRGVLARAHGRPGHIFNLGHGLLPDTPLDHVLRVIDTVRAFDPSAAELAVAGAGERGGGRDTRH